MPTQTLLKNCFYAKANLAISKLTTKTPPTSYALIMRALALL